ncbi:MAG TPA: helix-turn-helix domain-containing protein [Polyangiaceae bacterium]|jgi:chromosomal replication initiation ATPase DnaA
MTSTEPQDSAPGAQPIHLPLATAVISRLRAHNLIPLLRQICDHRGVGMHELCGRGRSQNLGRARQELWWQIRNHPHRCYSYPEIGRLFHRDHTTIRHGILAYQKRAGS